jgi:hypothetical protein
LGDVLSNVTFETGGKIVARHFHAQESVKHICEADGAADYLLAHALLSKALLPGFR